VPADLRLATLRTATLRTEQSSLTGEPVAVFKGLEPAGDLHCELQVRPVPVGWGGAPAGWSSEQLAAAALGPTCLQLCVRASGLHRVV